MQIYLAPGFFKISVDLSEATDIWSISPHRRRWLDADGNFVIWFDF